jgi:hypothetical protein
VQCDAAETAATLQLCNTAHRRRFSHKISQSVDAASWCTNLKVCSFAHHCFHLVAVRSQTRGPTSFLNEVRLHSRAAVCSSALTSFQSMASNADATSTAAAALVVAATKEDAGSVTSEAAAPVAAAAPAAADANEATDSPSSSALRKLRSSSLDATAKAFIPGAAFAAAAVPAPVESSAPQKQGGGRNAGGGGGGGSALPDFSPEQSEALRHQVSARIHLFASVLTYSNAIK